MKRCFIPISLIIITFITGCATSDSTHNREPNTDVLYQTTPYSAMLDEVYDGDMTIQELKKYGDIGIGTFNALDGELIGLDSIFYQIKSDGIARVADDSLKTPFAVVTWFEVDMDKTVIIANYTDLEPLISYIDYLRPSQNIFYGIKLEGTFEYIRTKSVPKQDKPYSPLVSILQNQPEFEFHDVEGTIVGFWLPAYMEGINIPGYHLHFITKNRDSGGHLIDCRIKFASIEIDYITGFHMILNSNDEFYNADLTKKLKDELEKVEQYRFYSQ